MYISPRTPGTRQNGQSFDSTMIQAVWNKARVVRGYHADYVRADTCGALIERNKHGITSKYGWEIDHIIPIARNGQDVLDNLQPLQWQNNRAKSDGPLICAVK